MNLPSPRSDFVDEYIRETLMEMVSLFRISEDEATGRISQVFGSWNLIDPEVESHLGHEEPRYWAHFVYHGPSVAWWRESPENLTPRPWHRFY